MQGAAVLNTYYGGVWLGVGAGFVQSLGWSPFVQSLGWSPFVQSLGWSPFVVAEEVVLEVVGVLLTAKAHAVPELEILLCEVLTLGHVHRSVSTFNGYLCQSDRSPRAVQWFARAQSPQ